MPTFDAKCERCTAVTEYVRQMSERNDTPHCPACGHKMAKVILSAPMGYVSGNFEPFKSPVDGAVIGSQRDLREHNSRNNVVSLHDGYDDATITSGKFNTNKPPPKEDMASDIVESIQMLEQGYQPTYVGAEDE